MSPTIRFKNNLDIPVMVTVIVEKIAGEPEIRPSEEKIIDTEKGDTIITIYVSKTPLPSKKDEGTGNKKLVEHIPQPKN